MKKEECLHLKDKKKYTCPFCSDDLDIITESEHCFAIRDGYPVSEGHTLIISKRHVTSWFELYEVEQADCLKLLEQQKKKLDQEYHPDGWNAGFNTGRAAGQTVFHMHLHLIPRYTGDIENPRGGIRNIIPGMGDYSKF